MTELDEAESNVRCDPPPGCDWRGREAENEAGSVGDVILEAFADDFRLLLLLLLRPNEAAMGESEWPVEDDTGARDGVMVGS